MNTQQVLAVFRLVLVVATIIVMIRNRCAPGNLSYSAPLLALMVHAVLYLVFYLVTSLFFTVNTTLINLWSATLQIHVFLTLLITEVARFYRQRTKQGVISGC